MKKFSFIDRFRLTDKFLMGEVSIILDKAIDSEGKDSVREDGRYFEFSDGTRVHCRFAPGDKVAVLMSYERAGLGGEFRRLEGWNNKRKVNEKYMPYHFVVEKVRCVRAQDITEEEALRAGLRVNKGGYYSVGGDCGGMLADWREMFSRFVEFLFRILYRDNPWVILYEITPVIGNV